MSIENTPSKTPPVHEALKHYEQLLWTSADVIAARGTRRVLENASFIESEWEDDPHQQRFNLQSYTMTSNTGEFETTYFLTTYPQFDAEPDGFFRYTTDMNSVVACDEDWSIIPETEYVDHTELVSAYLMSAADKHAKPNPTTPLDNVFSDIMRSAGLMKNETKPFEYVKDSLLRKLGVYIESVDSADLLREDTYEEVCRRLTKSMNEEFTNVKELAFNDEVISDGAMIYVLRENIKEESTTSVIAPTFQLRGKVRGLVVTELPNVSGTKDIIKSYDEGTLPPPRLFGLGLVVGEVRLRNDLGEEVDLPSDEQHDFTAWIPFDKTKLPMKRVVR